MKTLILLADDDPLVAGTLAKGLMNAGYDVLQADCGEAALRLCRERTPELAILDMRMPGLSGLDVARELGRRGDVPFMFLSAYNDADMVEEAAREGALGYLVKPLEIPQIIPAVRTALARAADMKKLKATASQFQIALTERREIGIAIGILSERLGLSTADAFLRLRQFARSRRRKVADLAGEIAAGTLDPREVAR